MDLSQFQDLSKPESIAKLISLPPPQDLHGKARKAELFKLAELFSRHWLALVEKKIVLPTAITLADASLKIGGEELWNRVLLVLAAYYDFAVRRLTPMVGSGDQLIPGLNLPRITQLLDCVKAFDATNTPPYHLTAILLTCAYFNSFQSAYFLSTFKKTPLPLPLIQPFESEAHDNLCRLINHLISSDGLQRTLLSRLVRTTASFLAEIYQNTKEGWNNEHRIGPFSSIKLSELSLLAKRDHVLLKKYGAKSVEKLFEHQLALITQSFGFYVIRTRTGKRTVDLVCISGNPSMTFLLEAKTTNGPYSLPTKDSRALIEYTNEVRSILATLPQLRFVLIIGPQASKTLHRKLIQLEAQAGIPIRFCTAQQIADLREMIPGPLPISSFVDRILTAPHVLTDESFNEVVKNYHGMQQIHSQFVDGLISYQQLPALNHSAKEK
jgi:hypothetical protein